MTQLNGSTHQIIEWVKQLSLTDKTAVLATLKAELESAQPDELEQQEWLKMAATNPVFGFLNDPEEDVYTLENGRSLNDEG
jgi:hypothetical protein